MTKILIFDRHDFIFQQFDSFYTNDFSSEWRTVDVVGLWGRRNYDLETKDGRKNFSNNSGYEIEFNNELQLVSFGDVAFRVDINSENILNPYLATENMEKENDPALLASK